MPEPVQPEPSPPTARILRPRWAIGLELTGGYLLAEVVGGFLFFFVEQPYGLLFSLLLVPVAGVVGILLTNVLVLRNRGRRLLPNIGLALVFSGLGCLVAARIVQYACGPGLVEFIIGWAISVPVACLTWHLAKR
jgi:hypothetical protein